MRTDKPKESSFMPDPSAMDISDKTFKEMAEATVKMVEETALENKDKQFNPVVFVHYREFVEGNMLSDVKVSAGMICGGFGSTDEKRETIKKIGRKFFQQRQFPVAVFMASECWVSEQKPGKDVSKITSPSMDPERTEAIVIHGVTIDGECKYGAFIPIKRGNDGTIEKVEEKFVTNEIAPYLLNCFFHGFFEKIIADRALKGGKSIEKPDIRS